MKSIAKICGGSRSVGAARGLADGLAEPETERLAELTSTSMLGKRDLSLRTSLTISKKR
jgi:hypothetical protein